MKQEEIKREQQRIESSRKELIERIIRFVPEDSIREPFPNIFIGRSSRMSEGVHSVFKPAFCVIAQGGKNVVLGEKVFKYDPAHYLISSIDLPIVSHIVGASKENPYLSFRLNLDVSMVASVIMESGIEITKRESPKLKAMDVSPIDADLLEAVVKLARLLDTPIEMKFLAPLIIREIIYRLLKGEQGARLSYLITSEGDARRIGRAVKQIREHFDEPLKIENIARETGMSVSGFHHHFKIVTAMSPLQFQKQIRLQEARRLMLGENLDVAGAGFRVGYDDPAYFSRDYKKLFGASPQRDIAKLRSNVETSATTA